MKAYGKLEWSGNGYNFGPNIGKDIAGIWKVVLLWNLKASF